MENTGISNMESNGNDMKLKRLAPSAPGYGQAIRVYGESGMADGIGVSAELLDAVIRGMPEDMRCLPYALYDGAEVAGFCLFTLYQKEVFACLEFVAIPAGKRSLGAARRFFRLIMEEAGKLTSGPVFSEMELFAGCRRDAAMERIIRSLGIGALECRHLLPSWALTYERIPGRMMIYPKPESISRESYLTYLRAMMIYNCVSWAALFMAQEELSAFTRYVADMYEEVKNALPKVIRVE